MTMLADILNSVFERRMSFSVSAKGDKRSVDRLTNDLVSAMGEVSGTATGKLLLDRFEAMDDAGKLKFFQSLLGPMGVDPNKVRDTLSAFEKSPGRRTYERFMDAVDPARKELFRRLNAVPGSTGRLVQMRSDLLRLARDNPEIAELDHDLRHLFVSWFNRGFLVLRPVNWESPAHILEKIIAYEAVHTIDSWDDLRRRVQPTDRRCFAFFHPAIPDEPLIFVEVALTKGVPGSVQKVLEDDREALKAIDANTAVFYSISNCQTGLAGISFGNSLIKQVAADLALELPGLKTFITLSPIPGFVRWLNSENISATKENTAGLAAHYLVNAKREDGRPDDSVARFHLGNGAQIHKVHESADVSEKGIRQSHGVMVNYLYDLKKIVENHEQYATQKKIAVSQEIRSLSANTEKALTKRGLND